MTAAASTCWNLRLGAVSRWCSGRWTLLEENLRDKSLSEQAGKKRAIGQLLVVMFDAWLSMQLTCLTNALPLSQS